MAKNVKKRVSVVLDINAKTAEKQIRSTMDNVKDIIANLGNAADKMGYFKELAEYLSQIDAAIVDLKSKHGDGVVNELFGSLDSNLRKEMEGLFGTTKDQLDVLQQLRDKMKNVKLLGDTPEAKAELKEIAKEVRGLFAIIGKEDEIKLSGNGKIETRIKNIEDALAKFALVWDGVNAKIANGFVLGGGGSGGAGVAGAANDIVAGLNDISDAAKEATDETSKLKEEYQEMLKVFSGKKIKIETTKKDDVDKLKQLVKEFKDASQEVEYLEGANKKSTDAYKMALSKSLRFAELLKNTMDDVADNGSSKGVNFVTDNVGEDGAYTAAEKFLQKYAKKDTFSTLRTYIEEQIVKMNDGYGSSDSQNINEIGKKSILYDDLNEKLKEYISLQKQIDSEDVKSKSYNELSNKIELLEAYFDELGQTEEEIDKIQNILSDLSFGDIDIKSAIDQLGEIVELKRKVSDSADSTSILYDGKGGSSGKSDAVKTVEDVEAKLQAFRELNDKIHSHDYYSDDAILNDVDVGKYTERLEVAKKELEELGDRGLLTAEQLEEVYDIFESAKNMLSARTNNYTGYGYGSGYSYDFEDDYIRERDRANSLQEQLDEIRSEKEKNDDAAFVEFNGITSELKDTGTKDLSYDEIRGTITRLNELHTRIRAMHGEYELSDELMDQAEAAYNEALAILNHAVKRYEYYDELRSLNDDATVSKDVSELEEIIVDRDALIASAERLNLFDEEQLDLQKRITEAIRERVQSIYDMSNAEDVDRENGSLETKLDLLRDIADEYGTNITQKDRNRFEELNTKDADVGLTDKESDRWYDLSDKIVQADDALEQFESTYDRIILTLSNGKTVDILPDDAGLRKLDKIANEYYPGEFNGFEIDDIVFVRKQEQAVIEQNNEELKEQLRLQEQINSEVSFADKTSNDNIISGEHQDLQIVLDKVKEIEQAVDNKTSAFVHEANVVDDVVQQEIDSLSKLKEYLEVIRLSIQELFNGGQQKIGFHSGDLDYYSKTGIRSENASQSGSQLLDGYGAFGTGIYYLSDPSKFSDAYANDKNKIFAIDLSKYNMYMAQTSEQAESLYGFLANLERFVLASAGYTGFEEKIDGINIDTLFAEMNNVFKNVSLPIERLQKFVDDAKEHITKFGIDQYGDITNLDSVLSNSDDITTRFMRLLGYQGVDVRGTSLDNEQTGSVVFDLDQSSPYVKAFDNVNDAVEYHNQMLGKTQTMHGSIADSLNTWVSKIYEACEKISLLGAEFSTISSSIKDIVDNLNLIGSKDNLVENDGDQIVPEDANVIGENQSDSNKDYTLDATVQETNRILGEISGKISDESPLSDVVDPLKAAVDELKSVASGIVEHQKAQRTDLTDSSARIANNYGQLSSIAGNAVAGLGDDVQIDSMKSLADNVVRVKGAVQDASGVWKGFVVDIDEHNNAVVSAIKEHDAFAKSLNESSNKTTKSAENVDDFNSSLDTAKASFVSFRDSLKDVDYLSDELRDSLKQLGIDLGQVSDSDGLKSWKDSFGDVKDEVAVIQDVFSRLENDKLKSFRGSINSEFKSLDFATTTSNPTAEQKEILDLREKLIVQIEKEKQAIKEGKTVEVDSLNAIQKELKDKIQLYREANDLEYGNSQKFGATVALNQTAKFKSLKEQANVGEFSGSTIVKAQLAQYEESFTRLIKKRKEFAQLDSLTGEQKSEFKRLTDECNKFAKALEKTINDSKKLWNSSAKYSEYTLGADFEDNEQGRRAAFESFASGLENVTLSSENFRKNYNECVFTVDNGDGTFTNMTATFDAARTKIIALAGDTKKATNIWSLFRDKIRSVATYFASSLSIQEVIQQIRKGIAYVKEIDSALTELKKVTDETEASYSRFLSTASKTSSEIGSTIADFTNATADFARLGYSLEQATELAKVASIYKNVGDGIDNISTASESIISTMKAFGIEADSAMGIVDKFNEVGNNFAISSTGIGEAMQRSASALNEAGNSIDESIALITAANSVIQNPEQVGTALKTLALRLRGTKTELEEAGEDVDGMAESTSQLQAKLNALTHGKVDIMIDSYTFKNPTEILREMSAAWKDMTDIERASALELMGGKRQANILSSIIKNFDIVDDVIKSSANSAGSALAENEKYLESIQGRIDLFNNSVQTLWMNAINSDVVKGFVDFGKVLVDIANALDIFRVAFAGLLTYMSASEKYKFDIASMLGVHELSEDGFMQGFKIFGKKGLTGFVSNIFNKKDSKKSNVAEAILGNSSSIKASVEDFANIMQKDIDNYVTIDTSKIDMRIQSIYDELDIARKSLDHAKSSDLNYYKSFGSTTPAKDRDRRIDDSIKKVKQLESDLLVLKKQRDEIVSSAVNNVAKSMSLPFATDNQAYESMLSVLTKIKDVKLSIGNEQDVASKIDEMSKASKNGQVELANYVSTLDNTDIALKAYAASVKDGQYSLAGFQQFITQHNNSVKASGIAAKAAAVGHQLLNAALNMGVTMIASLAINTVVSALDEFIKTNDELIEQADEIKNAYETESNAIKNNISTLNNLESEFKKLSSGVDEYGYNISLATDDYSRYQEIVATILGMSPSLIDSYDSEGNAIANKNGLLEKSIQLMQEEQRLKAQELVSDVNLTKIGGSVTAKLEEYNTDNPLPYQDAKYNFMKEFASAADEYDTKHEHENNYELFGALSFDGYSWNNYGSGNVYAQNFAQDYYDQIVADLRSEESILKDYFTDEQIKNMLDYASEYEKNVDVYNSKIKSINSELTSTLQTVPLSETSYYELSEEMKGYLSQYINSIEVTSDNLLDKKQEIIDLTNFIAKNSDVQKIVSTGFGLKAGKDEDGNFLTLKNYKKEIEQFIDEINKSGYTDDQKQTIFDVVGISTESKDFDNDIRDAIKHAENILLDEFDTSIDELSVSDILITTRITEDSNSLTFDELKQKIQETKDSFGIDISAVKTYSSISDDISKFNEILQQTSEIVVDNTEVSEEYKDALKDIGISQEDLNECFYKESPLVVKNAKLLNSLVNATKQNASQNAKLAKSQARLQYYELYKELKALTNGQVITSKATLLQAEALYAQMSVLSKTIAKYSMLEAELLGAANAYAKFADAQEADAATDYIDDAEGMITALGEAFNTAKLGTEAAQTAIEGLVPKSVYEDLDTVDEKMAAVYKYFKEGKLSQYFDIQFNDDGAIESVEMKLGNLRKFIEDGLSLDVFEGADWQHFEFSPEFLEQLENAPDKLQLFADKMGVTKEVAFAFLKSIEDHDIEWLGGDYSSLMEQIVPDSLETKIYDNTQALAELEYQLATGKISASEYAKQIYELQKAAQINSSAARENATGWAEATKEVAASKDKVETLTKELIDLKSSGASEIEIETKTAQLSEASKELEEAVKKKYQLEEPTEVTITAALDSIDMKMAEWKADNAELSVDVVPKLQQDETGEWKIPAEVAATLDDTEKAAIEEYLRLLNDQYMIQVLADENPEDATAELDAVKTAAELADKAIKEISDPEIDTTNAIQAITDLQTVIDSIEGTTVHIYETTHKKTVYSYGIDGFGSVNGSAHATGNWGLKNSEHNSLVGELGPELVVNPQTGRYYTVGDNGAEFVDLPKGAIIFNHKQTEGLLKNGYVTSRGKAYAEGNAHVTIWPNGSSKDQWKGTGYSSWDDPTYDLREALGSAAGSVGEFEEVIDWIEIRMEEFDERIGKLNAELDNLTNSANKNSKIDEIIAENQKKYSDSLAGAAYYEQYAQQFLKGMNSTLVEAAKNGAISITEFTKEQDEATVNAIQKYRDYAQKAADLYQQADEIIAEIRNLHIQQIDNAQHTGDVKAAIEASQTDKLQSAVDLQEESGLIASSEYYAAMAENSRKTVEYLSEARREMQKEFNDAVESGSLIVGSDEWYENLDKLYQIDAEIDEAVASLEEFQNAINDIYWAHFDYLINRLDYISEDTQSLIDLMDSMDMISKPEGAEWWTADDVKWTKEGMASLGLHAQEMERAEERAKMYAIAIDDLTAEYEAGHYSESEYLEKLNELTQGQYEAIEKAQDEKEAIVELNEARVDAIKEGIELEIEAYEELIEKKKEELDTEKDLYDFQKNTAEQSKNIADIQRKLAALSVDNSASAAAKRRQLEAELAEANAQLEETYYERSISNKQNALDKELEDFRSEKDAEITKLEEYLTNVEQVVTDSLTLVRANAEEIGATLTEKAEEYSLTVSDAVLNPWKDGALAIDEYTTKFGDTASSTINQLNAMRDSWLSVRSEIEAANKALDIHVSETEKYHSTKPASVADINKENAQYAAAQKKETPQTNTSTNTSTNKNNSASQSKAITVGGKINAGSAKIYSYAGGTGVNQYYKNDPIYTVLAQQGEWLKVRHHKLKSGVTGWFKKGSVKAYAKGSLGVDKDQLALIDELGEELVLHANNGKLSYLSKGTGVIPSDITANLMEWGALDPQEMIDRNRPSVGISPEVHNTEVNLTITYGDMVSIEEYNGGDIAELEKMVKKQFDKHTKDLNNAIRKYTR